LTSNNFTTAATIVGASAALSFTLVTRQIWKLDLLSVLKAAE
jgi:hypothetical protein